MQPNLRRRVHGAEFKARVLAECRQPGVSVAAVAMTHGLNVNLVRKWLIGRGLKRAGLSAVMSTTGTPQSTLAVAAPALQFVPVEIGASVISAEASPSAEQHIHVDLRRGSATLAVRWPALQAQACAAWLVDLAGVLK